LEIANNPIVSGVYRTALQDTTLPGTSEKIVMGERVFVSLIEANVRCNPLFSGSLLIFAFRNLVPKMLQEFRVLESLGE
jgi:hypothetical protein